MTKKRIHEAELQRRGTRAPPPPALPAPLPAPTPHVLIGLPYSESGALARAAGALGAATLISAGSLYRANERAARPKNRTGFQRIGRAAWSTAASLDSAGFVAMRLGGYRWTVESYVAFVVTNGGQGAMPFPWCWWSAMDFCCEAEIAADRAEVERRIALTVSTYADTLEELQGWRDEGATDVPDPLPILQGRAPEDYVRCAAELGETIDRHHRCTCPRDPDACSAEWHRPRGGLPALVGVGSVCRRELHGSDGLLSVLAALDAALPAHVKLHLFGVKGALLRHLGAYAHRVASVDSMAYDFRARKDAQERRRSDPTFKATADHRSAHLEAWYRRQRSALDTARPSSPTLDTAARPPYHPEA